MEYGLRRRPRETRDTLADQVQHALRDVGAFEERSPIILVTDQRVELLDLVAQSDREGLGVEFARVPDGLHVVESFGLGQGQGLEASLPVQYMPGLVVARVLRIPIQVHGLIAERLGDGFGFDSVMCWVSLVDIHLPVLRAGHVCGLASQRPAPRWCLPRRVLAVRALGPKLRGREPTRSLGWRLRHRLRVPASRGVSRGITYRPSWMPAKRVLGAPGGWGRIQALRVPPPRRTTHLRAMRSTDSSSVSESTPTAGTHARAWDSSLTLNRFCSA